MKAESKEEVRLRRTMRMTMILGLFFIAIAFTIGVWIPLPGGERAIAGQGKWTMTVSDLIGIIVATLVFPCMIWGLSLSRRLDALRDRRDEPGG